jgi:ABC-type sugar transport system ATPase subunit
VSAGVVQAGSFSVQRSGLPDGPITMGIRPEALRPDAHDSTDPHIELLIEVVEPLGDEVLAHGTVDARAAQSGAEEDDGILLADVSTRAPVTVRLAPDARPHPGDRLPLTADPAAVLLFEAMSGLAVQA